MYKSTLITLTSALLLSGCAHTNASAEKEQEIPLSEVPPHIMKAAKASMKGFLPHEAELEVEDGQTIYEIEGTVKGRVYEVEVDMQGKVLEVEAEES